MTGLALALAFLRRRPLALLLPALAIAGCFVPILVIWSIKAGYVDALLDALRSDPRHLEIRLRGDRTLAADDIARMSALEGMGYLVPTTRGLAVRIYIGRPGERRQVDASLLPSTAGDPLLGPLAPPDGQTAILSSALAHTLAVQTGGSVELRAIRSEGADILRIPLRVGGVLDPPLMSGRRLLVQPDIILAVETFVDGYALPDRGITAGRPASERNPAFANARIYARTLEMVAPLVLDLERLGNIAESDDGAIAFALALERGATLLVLLFGTILSVGAALTIWGAIALGILPQKRTIALFRLMGGTRTDVAAFVLLVDGAIMVSAFLMAGAAYAAIAITINARFAGIADTPVCALPLSAVALAAGTVLTAALGLGGIFARVLLGVAPREALSHET